MSYRKSSVKHLTISADSGLTCGIGPVTSTEWNRTKVFKRKFHRCMNYPLIKTTLGLKCSYCYETGQSL